MLALHSPEQIYMNPHFFPIDGMIRQVSEKWAICMGINRFGKANLKRMFWLTISSFLMMEWMPEHHPAFFWVNQKHDENSPKECNY